MRARYQSIVWGLALVTALAGGAGLYTAAMYGRLSIAQLAYVSAILAGVVGALILSQQPHNSIGRLLLVMGLLTGLSDLPLVYGAPALWGHQAGLPGSRFALWLDSWLWILPFGLSTPIVFVRFPTGRLEPRWRFVPWLAVAGVVLMIPWGALSPGPLFFVGIDNPYGVTGAQAWLGALAALGIVIITGANIAAISAVVVRYRQATGDERQQIKWIAFAGGLVAVAVLYAVVATLLFRVPLVETLLPFGVVVIAGPIALGFAILRYRLYDIDLIINRALVYGTLTAIVAGLYASGVTLLQRLYVLVTGQKSDAAVVITAFAVAVLFSPIRDRLQKIVDHRLGGADPVAALDSLRVSVESVVRVLDAHRIARRLVDVAVDGYQAHYAALYLNQGGRAAPFYARGKQDHATMVEIPMRREGSDIGRLVLGRRRGAQHYSERDRRALEEALGAVGEALWLALELGHSESGELSVVRAESSRP